MNRIPATIQEVQSDGSLSLVGLETASGQLTCIVIDTPETCDYLVEGKKVTALFKETEVAIGKNGLGEISLRNRIKGMISGLDREKLLCRVALDTASGMVKAVITTNAAQQMALETGMEVHALIKTNEIMLAHD